MDISSKHTNEIFALLDRFFISSGALGFWHDPSQIINTVNYYLETERLKYAYCRTKTNANTGVITYSWIEKHKPFILNIPYKEGDNLI